MLKILFLVAVLVYGVAGQAPAVRYEVCVLAEFGLLVSVRYPKADNTTGSTPLMFRGNANVRGTCAEQGSNVAVMRVNENQELGMKLVFTRNETHPHRIYCLSEFEVWYVYTQNRFPKAKPSLYGTRGSEKASGIEWFQAPEEYSYLCREEQSRRLQENVDIVLSDLRIQPFEVKHNDFSEPLECATTKPPPASATKPRAPTHDHRHGPSVTPNIPPPAAATNPAPTHDHPHDDHHRSPAPATLPPATARPVPPYDSQDGQDTNIINVDGDITHGDTIHNGDIHVGNGGPSRGIGSGTVAAIIISVLFIIGMIIGGYCYKRKRERKSDDVKVKVKSKSKGWPTFKLKFKFSSLFK